MPIETGILRFLGEVLCSCRKTRRYCDKREDSDNEPYMHNTQLPQDIVTGSSYEDSVVSTVHSDNQLSDDEHEGIAQCAQRKISNDLPANTIAFVGSSEAYCDK